MRIILVKRLPAKIILQDKKWVGKLNNREINCFLFDNSFYSKRNYDIVEDIVTYFIGIFKTTMEGFCKETIDRLTHGGYWHTWLNYQYWYLLQEDLSKCLIFIATDGSVRNFSGVTYSEIIPERCSNVSIHYAPCL